MFNYWKQYLATAALIGGAFTAAPAQAQVGDVKDVPDPTIIAFQDHFLVFSTADGIPIRKSNDLIHWETIGRVFEKMPDWIYTEVPGTGYPWAPDISYFNGLYHVYYAQSTFGSQRSVIGLAVNKTLDPSSPDYKWEDRGKVLESRPGIDDNNAIDANIILDDNGEPWMAWGSFWGGIRMKKIDKETGLLSKEDTTLYKLATREGGTTAIEAPYIIRKNGWYYLFVSWDICCEGSNSTYNVRVGRSKTVTGPYLDREGKDMMAGGGTLVLEGDDVVKGPGHSSVVAKEGTDYLVHHYVNIKEGPASPDAPLAIPRSLQIRPLAWDSEGWPKAGAPLTDPR